MRKALIVTLILLSTSAIVIVGRYVDNKDVNDFKSAMVQRDSLMVQSNDVK